MGAMTSGRRPSLRRRVRQLHLLMGLTLGVYLAVMGLTGSVLVFGEELEPALNPALHHVEPTGEPLSWAAQVAAFRARYPEADVSRVIVPEAEDRAVIYWIGPWTGSMPMVFQDPYTGEILGEQTLGGSFVGWVRYFHIYLYAGPTGMLVNGYLGLAVLLLLATGLYLWWPGTLRVLAMRLQVAWRSSWARVNWDAHQALGAWSLPVMLLIVLTGVAFPFYGQVAAAVGWWLPISPPLRTEAAGGDPAAVPANTSRPDLDAMVRTAQAGVPDGRLALIYAPDADEGPLRLLFFERDGEAWYRYVMAAVDRRTGELLDTRGQETVGDKVLGSLYPLHTGRFAGLPTKLLYVAVGISPSLMLATGIAIWWRRRTTAATQRQVMGPRRSTGPTPATGASPGLARLTAPQGGSSTTPRG